MRINGSPYIVDLTPPEAIAKESGATKATEATRAAGRLPSFDRVEISSKAVELDKLKKDLDSLPDVRRDRVALAKQNLQEGGYRIEPNILARKMMEAYGAA